MTTRHDVVEASRLVQRALDRERPRAGGAYAALLARYRTDTAFADTVTAVCEGLGLYILGDGPTGLLLHGDADGPFRVTLDNCGLNVRDTEHRYVYALVLAAVAAYGYRDGEALSDTSAPVLRCADLEKFLSRAVAGLAGGDDRPEDGDNWDEMLGIAGRQWLERPEIHTTKKGRPRIGCHRWYTTTVLEWLAQNGMAVRQPALSDERGDAYQLTDRFRLGIAELVDTNAFAVLAAAATEDDADDGVAATTDAEVPRDAAVATTSPWGSPAAPGANGQGEG